MSVNNSWGWYEVGDTLIFCQSQSKKGTVSRRKMGPWG